MTRNYLKIAFRNLKRHKVYNFINIAGLAVALAACILILVYIRYELSFDRFNKNANQIDRVYLHSEHDAGPSNILLTSYLLGPSIKKDIPGVRDYVRINNQYHHVLVGIRGKKIDENDFYFVDPSIFDVFSFHLIKGNPKTVLNRPFTLIITQRMAKKFFGNKNPIGEKMSVKGIYGTKQYKVTGVMKNVPHNAHFNINFLTSTQTFYKVDPAPDKMIRNWYMLNCYTYILLKKRTKPESISSNLHTIMVQAHKKKYASSRRYKLQTLTSIHLHSHFPRELAVNSDIKYLYIFGSIAFLILMIAGFNYINLMTARSEVRYMEIGIKKTLGVNRSTLILQFVSESLLHSFVAFLLAICLSLMVVPYFDHITGLPTDLSVLNIHFVLFLLVSWFIIGVLAGLYPAFVLSGIKPDEIFRRNANGKKKSYLRNTLIVFQFVISIVLIAGTFIITSELGYIRHKRLGIDSQRVLMISADQNFYSHYTAFRNSLLGYPDIADVTFMNQPMPTVGVQHMELKPDGIKKRLVNNYSVGPDFLKTLGIKLIKGDDFFDSSKTQKDSTYSEYTPVLVNEAAVKQWGWNNPIDKKITGFLPAFRVIGVVSNFNYRSLKDNIEPLILWPSQYCRYMLVRINSENKAQALLNIKKTWRKYGPGTALSYTFLSNRYDSLYQPEDLLSSLFGDFSILAVIIACMGLFGLAAFSTEQRTKEIGIRKVLGASVTGIVALLSKEFLRLVGIGFLIAVPIAWYTMHRWLQNFAYHINIGVWTFVLVGVAAMMIALLTVSWQSIRAAVANPVDSLRNE